MFEFYKILLMMFEFDFIRSGFDFPKGGSGYTNFLYIIFHLQHFEFYKNQYQFSLM